MIKTAIIAPIVDYQYKIPICMDSNVFSIKLDIGASNTVVSIDAFAENLAAEDKKSIIDYCEDHSQDKKTFQSASGDLFWGYPVVARNVVIGETMLDIFYYYLVIDNKRNISLLGVDFLDNCGYYHNPHGSINITDFDTNSYPAFSCHPIENTDLISFIDSIF